MPTGRMLLYTPASVMTSARVKQAMLQDYGSKGSTFLNTVASIRREVLHISGAQSSEWTVVPMQGNATIGLEATLGSVVPRGGKCCLVIRNGSCGTRMLRICERLAIPTIDVCLDEVTEMDLHHIEKVLKTHAKSISSVGMVHCETSTGQLNPVAAMGSIIRARVADATFIVDATSSFGGVPLSVPETHCDYLITSCNRSLQCVPGFSLVLARRAHERVVEDSNKSNRQKGCTLPRSFALDLWSQHKHMEERGGEFHATPPVHAMMAFQEALEELKLEGGVVQRAARYQRNTHRLLSGMMRLGFHPFLDPNMSTFGHIATAFRYPNHPAWCFDTFCAKLTEEKCYIHPRSLTCREPTFRVGSIGDIHPCDMEYLLVCVKKVMNLMGLESMRENPVVQYTPPAGKYPNPGKKVI